MRKGDKKQRVTSRERTHCELHSTIVVSFKIMRAASFSRFGIFKVPAETRKRGLLNECVVWWAA